MTPPPTGNVTFLFTDIEGSTRLWEENPEAMRQALARHDSLLRDVMESSGGRVFKTTGDGFCAAFRNPWGAARAALAAQLAILGRELKGFSAGTPAERAPTPRGQKGRQRSGASGGDGQRLLPLDGTDITSSSPSIPAPSPRTYPPDGHLCGDPDPIRVPQLKVRMALHTGHAERRDSDYFGPTLSRVARLLEAGHGSQVLLSGATRVAIGKKLPAEAALKALGVHRLRDLQEPEHIFQILHPALPADFPPLRTVNAHWMAHHSQSSATMAPLWFSRPAPLISTSRQSRPDAAVWTR